MNTYIEYIPVSHLKSIYPIKFFFFQFNNLLTHDGMV